MKNLICITMLLFSLCSCGKSEKEKLREENAYLINRISELENQVEYLESENNDLRYQIDDLESSIRRLRIELSNCESQKFFYQFID